MKEQIITQDGLFYKNFSSTEYTLSLLEGSESYSPELIYISDNYGLKRGVEQEPKIDNGQFSFGLYIVDWQNYLEDTKNKIKTLKK